MGIWRFGGTILLLALAAQPCSVSPVRKLWSKKPGSESRLFAFERNGRVGFIDPRGKVVVDPAIVAPIEDLVIFQTALLVLIIRGTLMRLGGLSSSKSIGGRTISRTAWRKCWWKIKAKNTDRRVSLSIRQVEP